MSAKTFVNFLKLLFWHDFIVLLSESKYLLNTLSFFFSKNVFAVVVVLMP